MRIQRFLLASALIVSPLVGQVIFEKTYGGNGSDQGRWVLQTNDSGYIIAGWTTSYGSGDWDVYVIRTDSLGDTLWTRTYGGSQRDEGCWIQKTNDGGYVIGGGTYSFGAGDEDFYLIKIDDSGDTLWTRTYGGSQFDRCHEGFPTDDGGFILVGPSSSFGSGSDDICLIKVDSIGNQSWIKTYGAGEDDWGNSVCQTHDKGFIITGTYSADREIFLLKTDSIGNQSWRRRFGGPNRDYANFVKQTSDKGYLISGWGYSYGSYPSEMYLIKTDSMGYEEWIKTYGGVLLEGGYCVDKTSDNGYISVGWTSSYGNGNYDVYLVKTDESGNQIWLEYYGGPGYDEGWHVQQTVDNCYIVAGWRNSYSSGDDVYLIKTMGGGPQIVEGSKQPLNRLGKILKISPNPFKNSVAISYLLSQKSHVELIIFDEQGRLIKRLDNGNKPAGVHVANWNGCDQQGKTVPNGVYFAVMSINGYRSSRKMIKLK